MNRLVCIGGSAGSLPVILQILQELPANFTLPILIVIHRQKNVASEMQNLLAAVYHSKKIIEPNDKHPVEDCCIYLAPQNYHLLIEHDRTFSLDYSEAVRFSRPSIDVSLESAAMVYKEGLHAILLSGANRDGAAGLQAVLQHGGVAIVQDPATAEYTAMPNAAIELNEAVKVLAPAELSAYLCSLNIQQ